MQFIVDKLYGLLKPSGYVSRNLVDHQAWKLLCEDYCFWLQKLRFLGRLWTDLAKIFGDL